MPKNDVLLHLNNKSLKRHNFNQLKCTFFKKILFVDLEERYFSSKTFFGGINTPLGSFFGQMAWGTFGCLLNAPSQMTEERTDVIV
jgi:hypothetical protein